MSERESCCRDNLGLVCHDFCDGNFKYSEIFKTNFSFLEPPPVRPTSASFSRSTGSWVGQMEISVFVLARQALVYGHVIAFAWALATILKEDARLLRAERIDAASLLASAKLVKWLLLALWATGIPMVIMDIGTDVSLLLGNSKLVAKLIVVAALTLNGFLLHFIAFPMLIGKPKNPAKVATIAASLGAISTMSWLYASFLGATRIVAPYFSLFDFVSLYLFGLAIALPIAILVVRNRLERSLKLAYNSANLSANQGYNLSVALIEAEIGRLALADIQRRLRMKHSPQQFSAREAPFVTARQRTTAASGGSAARWRVQ